MKQDLLAPVRAEFRRKIIVDIAVGFGFSILLTLLTEIANIGTPLGRFFRNADKLTLALAGFAFTAWLTSVAQGWRDLYPQAISRAVARITQRWPELYAFVHQRMQDLIVEENDRLTCLMTPSGVPWEAKQRLDTASELVRSCTNIKTYVATWTDPPYDATGADRRFFERHRERLRRTKARRLVVYPEDKLLQSLTTPDACDRLRSFVQLHAEVRVDLRYFPGTHHELRRILEESLGPRAASDVLVDFGIINEDLVFGQQSTGAGDEERPSGHGRVVTDPALVEQYVRAFDSAWERLLPDCYAGRQLETFAHIASDRIKAFAIQNASFFDETVAKIAASKTVMAVDVARDMSNWWRNDAYKHFLNATIASAAANGGGRHVRAYVFSKFLDETAAQLFHERVAIPQLKEGVELLFLSRRTLVSNKLPAVDCIMDDDGWGFYLLPSDDFTPTGVSAARNGMTPHVRPVFEQVYRELYECLDSRILRATKTAPLSSDTFVNWLRGLEQLT